MDEKPLSDLSDVEKRVQEARDAEQHLEEVMPNAILADDSAFPDFASTSDVSESGPVTHTPTSQVREDPGTERVENEALKDVGPGSDEPQDAR